jgi:hypothetical protein
MGLRFKDLREQALDPVGYAKKKELESPDYKAQQKKDLYYGDTLKGLAGETADYVGGLKANVGKNVAKADIYNSQAGQQRALDNARAGLSGVDTSALNEQSRRNASFGAASINEDAQRNALDLYGTSITNRIEGANKIDNTEQALEIAKKAPAVSSGGGGGTLGCLALVSVGLMSDKTYASESPFINKQSFEYIGYAILIAPFVPMILKNGKFARAFSFLAHKYVYNLTGEKKSLTGKAIALVGGSVCKLVGKVA